MHKGGIRLHPIRDGVIPTVREARLRHRDQGGNILTEVTNPSTGLCDHVTSPLLEVELLPPVFTARPVVPTKNPKRDTSVLPQKAPNGTWYQGTGNNKRAIRTTELGDKPLPLVAGRRTPGNRKGATSRASKAAAPTPTGRQTGRPDIRMPTELVDAYIVGKFLEALRKVQGKKAQLPKGFKITPEMRKAARAAIRHEQDVAVFCDEQEA